MRRTPTDIKDTELEALVRRVLREEFRTAGLRRELLTVCEAADVLGMSEGALRKAIQRRQVPVVRVGARIRVDIDALGPPHGEDR